MLVYYSLPHTSVLKILLEKAGASETSFTYKVQK